MNCKICDKEVKDMRHLGCHIIGKHTEISVQRYYDEFLKIEGEDKCKNPECQNRVSFTTLGKGYKTKQNKEKFCSVSCSRSSKEVQEKQRKTCLDKYGDPSFRNPEKNKETCLEKYGVENVLCKGTDIYHKRNLTIREKYGVDNVFQSKVIKEKIEKTMKEKDIWIDYDNPNYSNYKEYYRISWNFYKSIKSEFLENWNGYDYYDNEYIKDNFNKDPNDGDYPSIDHKLSIKDCYKAGKSPIEASDFNNLCVTKRRLNSAKKNLNIEDFIKSKNLTIQ
jgi:hypothetical protein